MSLSRIAIGLIAVGLLFECSLSVAQTPGAKSTNEIFGKPASVETGNETEPSDQGFLQCAVDVLSPQYRHDSTSALGQNLSMLTNPQGDVVVVGHGSPGLICTGEGDNCYGLNAVMVAWDNDSFWQSELSGLRGQYRSITMLGCNIAAGGPGNNLLSKIHDVTGLPVRAPDSAVVCSPGGFTFLNGGGWTQVTTEGKVAVRPSARHKFPPARVFKFSDTTIAKSTEEFVSVKPEDVHIITFQHRTHSQHDFQSLPIPDEQRHKILDLIDFENPFTVTGRLGAIATGKLRLKIGFSGRYEERDFIVYNDELVEDSKNRDVFYYTSSGFSETMQGIFR